MLVGGWSRLVALGACCVGSWLLAGGAVGVAAGAFAVAVGVAAVFLFWSFVSLLMEVSLSTCWSFRLLFPGVLVSVCVGTSLFIIM